MFKKIFPVVIMVLNSALVFAAEQKVATQLTQQASSVSVGYFTWTVIIACAGLALAAMFCGIGQAIAVSKAVESIARQPEATGQIQTAMILGLAFIESLVIYVLLIALILLFVNPFMKYFIQ